MTNGNAENKATWIGFAEGVIQLGLADGRKMSTPLRLYPSLLRASKAERESYEILGGGEHLRWPALDLDLETEQIVLGEPEAFPAPPLPRPGRRGRQLILHVRFRRGEGWAVRCARPSLRLDGIPNKLEASAEAISIGRALAPSRVVIHDANGKRRRVLKLDRTRKHDAVST